MFELFLFLFSAVFLDKIHVSVDISEGSQNGLFGTSVDIYAPGRLVEQGKNVMPRLRRRI